MNETISITNDEIQLENAKLVCFPLRKEYHSYNTRKEYYYYDIWKIQAQDLFSPHPKIILFIEPFTKIIIVYNNNDSFEDDLNYLLESMVED